jgi:hypothetical protein
MKYLPFNRYIPNSLIWIVIRNCQSKVHKITENIYKQIILFLCVHYIACKHQLYNVNLPTKITINIWLEFYITMAYMYVIVCSPFYHDCWEFRFLIGWLPVVNKSPYHGIVWSLAHGQRALESQVFLAFPINYFQLLSL